MNKKKRMENTSTTKYSKNGIVSTNYNLFVFKSILFRDQILRIVNNVDKKPYFLSSDIAKVLLYKNLDSMAKMLVKDNDKFQYKNTNFYSSAACIGIQPNTIFINLQGFNDVLLRTKSKNAKSLKKWLLLEILPCFDEFYTEESAEEEEEEEEEECGDEETKEDNESKKIFKLTLSNNEVSDIDVREDGYINATQLCKAGNKIFRHYISSEQTHNYLENLSSNIRIPILKLFDYKTGKSYVHRKVAYHLAQWISPQFETQFDNCLKEYDKQLIEELSSRQIQHPLIQDTTFKLKLLNNEILDIAIRRDGYVNATELCKAGNKLFADYQRMKQTQSYFQALSTNMGIPILELLDSKVGGSHSGTYVHRKVAYHLAQWISPQFAVQVSNVLDELMLTGKVELGNEKSNEELENVYKEKLSEMGNQLENTKNELKVLSKTHNSMLKRQKRTPYEIGNVVYIVSHEAFTGFYKTDYFKVGEATQTSGEQYGAFVNRLSGYNTSAPINFKVNFLIYIEENKLVENSTLVRFRKNLNPSNKEWIKSVDFKTITEYIVSLCELMNIEYKIVVNDPIVQNMEICGEVEEEEDEEENEEEDEEEEIKEEERKKLNGKYECVTCHECNISDKRAMNCVACAQKLSRKVKQRPTREQLLEDTRTMSVVDIGKKYGVSDNCIRKWIKNS